MATPVPELKGLAKAFNTIISRAEEAPARTQNDQEERAKVQEKLRKQIRELRRTKRLADGHTKVDVLKKDAERQLRKVATQGVVALFNAVRQVKEAKEAGEKVEEMPIDSFMDLLKSK